MSGPYAAGCGTDERNQEIRRKAVENLARDGQAHMKALGAEYGLQEGTVSHILRAWPEWRPTVERSKRELRERVVAAAIANVEESGTPQLRLLAEQFGRTLQTIKRWLDESPAFQAAKPTRRAYPERGAYDEELIELAIENLERSGRPHVFDLADRFDLHEATVRLRLASSALWREALDQHRAAGQAIKNELSQIPCDKAPKLAIAGPISTCSPRGGMSPRYMSGSLAIVQTDADMEAEGSKANDGVVPTRRQYEEVSTPTASEPCPTDLLDAKFGIEDPVVSHLVAVAFSRIIGETKTTGNYPDRLARCLEMYAVTTVTRDGRHHEAPAPLIAGRPISAPTTILKRHGLTQGEHEARWADAKDDQGFAASLPVEYLCGFIRPELWQVAAAVILDGPSVATDRFERVLHVLRDRQVAADRSREAGRIADSYVQSLTDAFKRLLKELNALAHRSTAFEQRLEPWKALPHLTRVKGRTAPRDSSVPSLRDCRLLWQKLDEDIRARLRVPLADQPSWFRNHTVGLAQNKAVWTLARDRAAFVTLFCLGSRITAHEEIKLRDYDPRRRLPDGEDGPALRVYPKKTKTADDASWKPITSEHALVIETHLAYCKLVFGERPDNAPLITRDRTDPLGPYLNLGERLAGQKGSLPLLPKAPGSRIGSRAHKLRSTGTQAIRSRAGQSYIEDHRIDYEALLIAEALTDHDHMSMDAYGYAGAKTRVGRERLAGYGTHILWELLTTDRGARKVPDVMGFRSALRTQQALLSERKRLNDELSTVTSAVEAVRLSHLSMRLSDELRVLDREIVALRTSATRLVCIPDDIGRPVIDLDVIEQEETGSIERRKQLALAPVRNWFSVAEMSEIGEVSDASPRNWVAGRVKAGDTRAPWEPDRIPVDDTFPRRKKILVAGLKASWLDQGARRERMNKILATPGPLGWSGEQCDSEAIPPAWMRDKRP